MQNRLIAVGDIHGEIEKLNLLLDKLLLTSNDKVIFLGDYIDRGEHSKEVIDRLIELSKTIECVFLKGNHEEMLLNTRISRRQEDVEHWLLSGGITTYDNYGDYPTIFNLHGIFLENLKPYHIENNCLFVHAGINPDKKLEEQNSDDLFWIREEFYERSHSLPYKIIFGHTPFTVPFIADDKIGIDTGCGKIEGSVLTAYDTVRKIFITS